MLVNHQTKETTMKNKKLTSDEIRAEAAAVRKEINGLKSALRKLRDKAKKTATRAWKLNEELDKQYKPGINKYDTKQKWLSKIITDLDYWQDADYDIDNVIRTW